MATFKRILVALLAGIGVGTVVAVLVAPSLIAWWARPPTQTAFSCNKDVEWALSTMRMWIAGTAGVGGLAGIAAAMIFRKKAAPAGGPVAAPPKAG